MTEDSSDRQFPYKSDYKKIICDLLGKPQVSVRLLSLLRNMRTERRMSTNSGWKDTVPFCITEAGHQ